MSNKEKIINQYESMKGIYDSFAEEVNHLLKRLLCNKNITYNAITFRVKDKESLSKKIDRKNDKYEQLTDITDIAGIRVISYYADDVDKIAQLVEEEFVIDVENSIDKRKALEPDRFGYCSVHYVVQMSAERLKLNEYSIYRNLKCEIQIRSVLQHAWAEIEHDLGYKSEVTVPRDVRRNFSRLAGLLEIADKEFQEIRHRLTTYKEEVQVNIANNEYANMEIDAITLETLIDNNDGIGEINSEILSIFKNVEFEEKINPIQCETSIKGLQFLGIYTLEQLLKLIQDRKEDTIKFVSVLSEILKDRDKIVLSKSVAFMYLCYVELLHQTEEIDNIEKYLRETRIIENDASCKGTAELLLKISNQLQK